MPSQNTPVQRLKAAPLPLELHCAGLHNPFRRNSSYWQVSQEEAIFLHSIHELYFMIYALLYFIKCLCLVDVLKV